MSSTHGVVYGPDGDRTIRFLRKVATDPADLWSALTDPARLAAWFAPMTLAPEVGGEVEIRFDDGTVGTGEVLVWDPVSVLEFSWVTETGLATKVRYEIKPDGAESLLDMHHTAMSTAGGPHYAAGWHAMLDHLDAFLAGAGFDWDRIFEGVHDGYIALFSDGGRVPGPVGSFDAETKTLTLQRRFDVSPEELWAALTEPERVREWFAPVAIEPRVGGRFRADFDEEQWVEGTVSEWDPPKRFAHSWSYVGGEPGTVAYEIAPEGDGSSLTFTHSGIAPEAVSAIGPGWHAFLDALLARTLGVVIEDDLLIAAVVDDYR